jgi:GWxTD domain-containing protein
MSNKLFLILVIFISPIFLFANKSLIVNTDYSVFFAGTADKGLVPYIEFYFSYPDYSYTLAYNNEEELYTGNLFFTLYIDTIYISNIDNNHYLVDKWIAPFSHKKDTSNTYAPQDFYGVRKYTLDDKKYFATIIVTDANDSNRKYENKFEINIAKKSDNVIVSDIQIANNIVTENNTGTASNSNRPQVFFKNNFYVYPNPLKEISAEKPTLYLYSEIYKAKTISPEGLNIRYTIYNAKNEIEFEYSKQKTIVADAQVETISIPLDAIETGVYTIEMCVSNNNNSDSIIKKNIFYLINSNMESSERKYYTEDEQFDLSEFATYSIDRIELEFEQSKIIASKDELATWDKLTDTKAKQRFLFRFWLTRNPAPENQYNTELAAFRERIKYVNTYFSRGGDVNGWKSDRGKIYIKYGEPDEREQHPISPEMKAYEVWTYSSIEGGAKFVFADVHTLDNFILIHSTATGYVQNSYWQDLISNKKRDIR